MTTAIHDAAFALAGLVALLLAFVVFRRVLTAVRERRDNQIRSEYANVIAEYLAVEDAPVPVLPHDRRSGALFAEVARDALVELTGGEHDRLLELVDRSGALAAAVGDLHARSRWKRRRAAETVSLSAQPAVREALLRALEDDDRDVRLLAARGIAELGDEGALIPLLESEAPSAPGAVEEVLLALAEHCPEAVGRIAAPSSVGALRVLALAVIGELRLAEQAVVLRDALSSPDNEVVARAARGLGLIGDVEALPLLRSLFVRRVPWFVHAVAARAMGALGSPDAVPMLEAELRRGRWQVQRNAAEALLQLGEAGAAALRRALGSPDQTVRAHAAAALDR